MNSELRRVQLDLEDIRLRLRPELTAQQPTSMVGRVVGTPPTSTPKWFSVQPVSMASGTPREAGLVGLSDIGSPVLACVVGAAIPNVGDMVVARMINGRWVAEGCCGATNHFDACFFVVACGRKQAGIEVRIYTAEGGDLLGSDVTDSDGRACIIMDGTGGTYWVEADSPGTGYAPYQASLHLSPGSTIVITIPLASGYMCPCHTTLGLGIQGPPVCPHPILTSLTFNDGFGDVSMSVQTTRYLGSLWDYAYSVSSLHIMGATYRNTVRPVWSVSKDAVFGVDSDQFGVITIPVIYVLSCLQSSDAGLVYFVDGFSPTRFWGYPFPRYVNDASISDTQASGWPGIYMEWNSRHTGYAMSGTVSCDPLIATSTFSPPPGGGDLGDIRWPDIHDLFPGPSTWVIHE